MGRKLCLVLTVWLVSACASGPVQPRRIIVQHEWTLPATARHTDLVCAEPVGFDPPVRRCRTVGDVRRFLAELLAAP